MKKQMQIELKELRYLELTCPEEKCRASVLLDMANDTQALPTKCPSCNIALVSPGSFADTLLTYKKFYETLAESKIKITFRLSSVFAIRVLLEHAVYQPASLLDERRPQRSSRAHRVAPLEALVRVVGESARLIDLPRQRATGNEQAALALLVVDAACVDAEKIVQ